MSTTLDVGADNPGTARAATLAAPVHSTYQEIP
jgi:hypothetical protein